MYQHELTVACTALREAIRFAGNVTAGLEHREAVQKSDDSPVTLADYGVQALVLRQLATHFPDDAIVAEEDVLALKSPSHAGLMDRLVERLSEVNGPWSKNDLVAYIGRGGHAGGVRGRFWTLDPIDGTKGFIRGEHYAIALSLIEDGRPVLGILGCPRLELPILQGGVHVGWLCYGDGLTALAESVDGTHCLAMNASPQDDTKEMVVCESVEAGHSAFAVSKRIAATLGIQRPPLRMDSQVKYAAVAAGLADAYLRLPTRGDYREKIWDHAAGVLLVESAGGIVCDVTGKPLNFSRGRTLADNRGVLACASGVAPALIAAVKPHFV